MTTNAIYADAAARAWLMLPDGQEIEYWTLQEAIIGWRHLPEHERAAAAIRSNGKRFSSSEIDHIHKSA
ncbi:MAG: hypothetical protein P4L82_19465 [Ancalomicrobiaceae bacterium]|nr:hypothetical protein [Ancalomicrobiaceae bacterium]